MDDKKYYICKKIDEPKRYFGLPLDELLLPLIVVILCFWFVNLLLGLVLGFLLFLTIRHFKKGQGSSWLLNLVYWHFPDYVMRGIFINKTPPSSYRYWLN